MTTIDHQPALNAEYEARASVWSDIQGHLPTLHDTVLEYPNAVVLELGVRWATSTAALLAGVDLVDGHLWSVDIVPPTYPGWWLGTGRWTLMVGDDLNPATLDAQPAEVDVLFIDTSHAYDHMLAELRTYVKRVKPGGVVMCHDTELEAPEMVGTQPPFPVARALDAFCEEAGLSWTNNTGSYGLGIIRVPAAEASDG